MNDEQAGAGIAVIDEIATSVRRLLRRRRHCLLAPGSWLLAWVASTQQLAYVPLDHHWTTSGPVSRALQRRDSGGDPRTPIPARSRLTPAFAAAEKQFLREGCVEPSIPGGSANPALAEALRCQWFSESLGTPPLDAEE